MVSTRESCLKMGRNSQEKKRDYSRTWDRFPYF